jgi:hypothetical protein
LSESCCWNVACFFLCSFWYLPNFMCVHMKCEEVIQVLFAPLASKDKKFTTSLQSQIAINIRFCNYYMITQVLFRNYKFSFYQDNKDRCLFFCHYLPVLLCLTLI